MKTSKLQIAKATEIQLENYYNVIKDICPTAATEIYQRLQHKKLQVKALEKGDQNE